MATYVAGDIQGCFDQLQRVLEKVAFAPGQDRLLCVGDMVNRGPKSLETLRFLKSLGKSFTGVLGNHDLHFLAIASGAFREGKVQTLLQTLEAKDCVELFEWMRQLPLAHLEVLETPKGRHKFLMVHAGIAPGWKFKQTLRYAQEVESALQGPNFIAYLEQMYGDQPDQWQESLSGMERLRVITNILTRIRFCDPAGHMNLTIKSDASSGPKGYQPWFAYQNLKPRRTILFGHWATLDGVTGRDNIIGLDTGCVWGRCMTLLRLEDGQRFSVKCNDV